MSLWHRVALVLAAWGCIQSLSAAETRPGGSTQPGEREGAAFTLRDQPPDGHALVAYLDCGREVRSGRPNEPRLVVRQGRSQAWPEAEAQFGPVGTAVVDEREVVCEVAGLDPEREYVLGFTWWDVDGQGRRQSVRFSTAGDERNDDGGLDGGVEWATVLPAGPVEAYYQDKPTWARIHLPITEAYRKGGRLLVGFRREGPAPAVVSEIALYARAGNGHATERRRVLIVTGDDWPGHLWRVTAPELAAIIRAEPRLEVTITESPAVLASPLLGHYHAVVLHYMNWNGRPDGGEAVWKELERYVESGGGLMLVHFACGAFQSWSGYVRVAGRVWDPKLPPHDPYGSFEVRVLDREHPITANMSDFRTTDELYTCLAGDTPIRVLAEARSAVDRKLHPMGFVHEAGRGRVFHSPLGHDFKALQSPGTRELFRRAAAWVAGVREKESRGDGEGERGVTR